MYRFNDGSLMTLYIKELLGDFNLPRCHVLTDRESPMAGFLYLDDGVFKRGTTSLDGSVSLQPVGRYDLKGRRMGSLSYGFGKPYLNITGTFRNGSMIYDAQTHKYLGDYLRFIRDETGLDLMSMYNCFSNMEASGVSISSPSGGFSFSSSDASYNIYVVPVRAFNDYSIALSSTQPVEAVACIYDGGVNDIFGGGMKFYNSTYVRIPYSRMHEPYLYRKLDRSSGSITSDVYLNDDHLCLLLKIPSAVETSVAVIEGDVTDEASRCLSESRGFCQWVPSRQYSFSFDADATNASGSSTALFDVDIPRYSNLQLLWMSSGISYPFADRLAEYLIGNVIDGNDPVSQNVRKVQERLMSDSFRSSHRIQAYPDDSGATEKIGITSAKAYGKWDDTLRDSLYRMVKASGSLGSLFDVHGYVDRDTERMLGI